MTAMDEGSSPATPEPRRLLLGILAALGGGTALIFLVYELLR